MNLKTGLIVGVIVLISGGGTFYFLSRQQSSETSVLSPVSAPTAVKIMPSSALKEYSDPSGFSFNYPDDLSLTANEATSDSTYADLQLKSKDVEGDLKLKIQDTKLASAGAWLKENGSTASGVKELRWGTLNAESVEDKDGIIFAAVDQEILFTMEVSYGGQKDFWQKVSDSILSSFAFSSESSPGTSPQTGGASAEDVTFEGEEVVE
ncbi:MAG: hypothetical protein Q8P89_02700 [bacterium]|nr:hypothetical protein [bacterium]